MGKENVVFRKINGRIVPIRRKNSISVGERGASLSGAGIASYAFYDASKSLKKAQRVKGMELRKAVFLEKIKKSRKAKKIPPKRPFQTEFPATLITKKETRNARLARQEFQVLEQSKRLRKMKKSLLFRGGLATALGAGAVYIASKNKTFENEYVEGLQDGAFALIGAGLGYGILRAKGKKILKNVKPFKRQYNKRKR